MSSICRFEACNMTKKRLPRWIVALSVVFFFTLAAHAQDTVALWEESAPGAQGNGDADIPSLTLYRATGTNRTDTAIIVCPGGGYQHLSMVKEGSDVAKWLNHRGISAAVLKYRLGPKYHY